MQLLVLALVSVLVVTILGAAEFPLPVLVLALVTILAAPGLIPLACKPTLSLVASIIIRCRYINKILQTATCSWVDVELPFACQQ